MNIKELQKNWNQFGEKDPMWAIITSPGKEGGKWDAESFFETGRKEIKRILRFLQTKGYSIPKGRTLDFGCGIGRLTQALAVHFEEIYGVDIAPAMIEQANSLNQHVDKCRYFLNEVDDLSIFEDQSFSFIYSNITLQHMETRYSRKYIEEFLRVLAPGGLLLFQLPSEIILSENASGGDYFRKGLRKVFGNSINQLYNVVLKFRNVFHTKPRMEMYGMPCDEVIRILSKPDIQILDCSQNNNAGSSWNSYQYLVTRTIPGA